MLERVARIMIDETGRYDRVIFDTAPTGHTLRLLSLPEIMAAWTDGLLRHRDRSDVISRAVKRMQRAGGGDDLSYIDQPPTSPATRARPASARRSWPAADLRAGPPAAARSGDLGFILVLIPEKLPLLESRKALDALRRFDVPVLGLVVNRVLPREPLGDFLEQRREQEARYLTQIASSFGDLPRVDVPLLARDVEGLEALRQSAGSIRRIAPLLPSVSRYSSSSGPCFTSRIRWRRSTSSDSRRSSSRSGLIRIRSRRPVPGISP
jgi:arsenite/tail-anchored protein-transporting ATPase